MFTSLQWLCLEDFSALLWNRFNKTTCHRRFETSSGYIRRRTKNCSIQTWDTVHFCLGNPRSIIGRKYLQFGKYSQCKTFSLFNWFDRFDFLFQVSSINRVLRNLGSKSMDAISAHETYYSVDSKLRVLHGQSWPSSSSSFYNHHPGMQPSTGAYSNSGDSNSEYKHSTSDVNLAHHQDLGGKKKILVFLLCELIHWAQWKWVSID